MSEVCLFEGETDLPLDTPLYRYMSIESFLYFLQFQRIRLSRITEWPDSYEGTRFDFLKRLKDDEFSNISKDSFHASCWTLQTEERSIYGGREDHFNDAQEELARNGSAAMWDSYCQAGGVRIKTTLGKLDSLLSKRLPTWRVFRGKVYYEASKTWDKTLNAPSLVATLLHKRVSFRSEAEYRFIVVPENDADSSAKDGLLIEDLYDFFDEILISPATSRNKWISRTLYNIAVNSVSVRPPHFTVNSKGGQQYCRISQLYNTVSEIVGHHDMA